MVCSTCVSQEKTGELRNCIDYRSLNAKTYKDSYSLPLIEDCLDSLYGKKLFCILDLCSGYYQIPLEKESRKRHHLIPDLAVFNGRGYPWVFVPLGPRSKGPCHWF